ncbi:hypothetical protein LJC56_06505 [Christensenellaceae bacterium OttesenSCG-928-K19]|nr:hypothetical protein [Christensenellaceae bacterium OttesenSCG-928-K19]
MAEVQSQEIAKEPEREDSLARIEKLLAEQAVHNEKMQRFSKLRTVMVVVAAAVIVVLGFLIYGAVSAMTSRVPQLVDTAQEFVEMAEADMNELFGEISAIDFAGMNDTMEEIGAIDFEGINSSIEGLSAGVEAFRRFAEMLANPFG